MSVISETYNSTHRILELEYVLPNVSFTANETNVVITSKNNKYELTDELSNDGRLKKISELHGIIV